jgi:hypothetical protein
MELCDTRRAVMPFGGLAASGVLRIPDGIGYTETAGRYLPFHLSSSQRD